MGACQNIFWLTIQESCATIDICHLFQISYLKNLPCEDISAFNDAWGLWRNLKLLHMCFCFVAIRAFLCEDKSTQKCGEKMSNIRYAFVRSSLTSSLLTPKSDLILTQNDLSDGHLAHHGFVHSLKQTPIFNFFLVILIILIIIIRMNIIAINIIIWESISVKMSRNFGLVFSDGL